ncbi:MAG: helix-turn-helix domain-containing protein [Mycobacteriaceae bacterium]|nr:helix-turn-helix domain-containing protein [Mycobacteriaceae bacterium]
MTSESDLRESRTPSPPTQRVIAVMELLAAQPHRTFTLAEITRGLGITRATGHAILATLAEHDWVVRESHTAGYSWGPAISALARPAGGVLRMARGQLRHLAEDTESHVVLSRRENASLVVIDAVGDTLSGPRLERGLTLPLVAPFGRDFVAWAPDQAQRDWLDRLGAAPEPFRERMLAVLAETRRRGFVVERLTREYVRVYSVLRALGSDGEPDLLLSRLAAAFADLTVVDFLPPELDAADQHQIATISAPVAGLDGVVTMAVTVAPFRALTAAQIHAFGEQARSCAAAVAAAMARYGAT